MPKKQPTPKPRPPRKPDINGNGGRLENQKRKVYRVRVAEWARANGVSQVKA
jgi:hypothetical protein